MLSSLKNDGLIYLLITTPTYVAIYYMQKSFLVLPVIHSIISHRAPKNKTKQNKNNGSYNIIFDSI